MHRFKELRVWQFARELCKDVYRLSSEFPPEEKYNLTSQMRRASVSILLNIGEGAGRNTKNDFARFLTIASGSAIEVETAAIVAFDQNYITESQLDDISKKVESLNNMLFRFQEKLRSATA